MNMILPENIETLLKLKHRNGVFTIFILKILNRENIWRASICLPFTTRQRGNSFFSIQALHTTQGHIKNVCSKDFVLSKNSEAIKLLFFIPFHNFINLYLEYTRTTTCTLCRFTTKRANKNEYELEAYKTPSTKNLTHKFLFLFLCTCKTTNWPVASTDLYSASFIGLLSFVKR